MTSGRSSATSCMTRRRPVQQTPIWAGTAETYNTVTSVENNPANSAAIKLTGELSPSVLLEASMNYDGNIINITNSPNVLHPSSWTPNTFFANSGSNQYSGVGWSGNGIGATMQTGYGAWHNAAQDYEPRVDLSVTPAASTQ